jgi:AcrR family transcriptional regulator
MTMGRPGGSASPEPELERLRAALVDEVVARGYESTTIEGVIDRAEVGRAEFDRHFKDLEDCMLQVYWHHTDEFTDEVRGAFDSEDRWRDGLRAAAYTAARWVRDHPGIVNFGTVQMFKAGLMAQAQRESHLQMMVDLIDAGRQELDDPDSMTRATAEGVFGSIYEALVKEQQARKGTKSAIEFVPELMYIAVRPYLGHDVAREELSMPAPPEPGLERVRGGP